MPYFPKKIFAHIATNFILAPFTTKAKAFLLLADFLNKHSSKVKAILLHHVPQSQKSFIFRQWYEGVD